MRIEWLPEADATRDDQLTYIAQDSIEAARDDLRVAVTVVDNDSADGTVEAVTARRPVLGVDVSALPMGCNAGFARGSNAGIARGRAPFVLLLNPDTVVAPGVLTSLVTFAEEHPRAGVVAPRLINPDGTDQLTARAFPTPAAAIFGRQIGRAHV